ncbi:MULTISPECIES: hypothetical protein [unclassified Streptomyces]|uniref:hypothetical protein n=1 Tax=unclassified Streptomyces TaxID=2593676 RepID=UPI002E3251E5|nr:MULTISPECIES: hypothetical protein [unclassified Streptomyces]
MLLSDLCNSLRGPIDWYGLLSEQYGVRESKQENLSYEVPEVREVRICEPLTPSLVLITAPAAVGKSTAADFMSNSLKCPILDLSSLQVGDGTLEGALSKSFGIRKCAEFLESLMGSQATLIIDALDEAEVRSGQANFRAFVRGLADTASQVSGDRAAIVIFSRAESSRLLQEVFDERHLQYAHFEIRPFGKEQAQRYLERRVSDVYRSREKELLHLKHVEPFAEARNVLFRVLASAIDAKVEDFWTESDVRDFLGYAPVLDVAAEYLAVDNFATLGSAIGFSQGSGFDQWGLVATVIDQLLLREQSKFVAQFTMVDIFQQYGNPSLHSILYSPEEQCARLLDYVENMSLPLELPAGLPIALRDGYETAADTQLSNHPFLRGDGWFNVIFRDYVTARAQRAPHTSESAAKAIRTNLLSSGWKHSPMYAFFSHALGRASAGRSSYCHSEDVGALYESFKSICETEDQLVTSVGRFANRLVATFSIARGNEESVGPLMFLTHEGTTSITFPRELSYANIWEIPEVILGGDQPSFKFGPSVYISSADLLFSSSEIQVYVGSEETPVLLTAKTLTSDSLKIQADAPKFMVICEEELSFPWSKYQRRIDLGGLAADSREQRALYLELRRIVLRFKDAKDGEAAVFQPFMDNLVIGGNARARKVLDYLQEIGCVNLSRSMYLLDFAKFAALGISRSQLRDLEMTDSAVKVSVDLLRFSKK